jgi:hypothetical protein
MRAALPALLLAFLVGCYGLAPYASYRPVQGTAGDTDTAEPDTDTSATTSDQGCPLGQDDDDDRVCDDEDVCPGGDDREDIDNDGVPDDCDFCPQDATDDSDGDGVCDSDDVCPGSSDSADRDSDGVPNGCDSCPDDPANDMDGDGICDSSDPCPGNAQNNCSRDIQVDIYADYYYYEITWEITDNGYLADYGTFAQPYDSYSAVYTGIPGDYICMVMLDSFGDGGSSGDVIDVSTGTTLTYWSAYDYGSEGDFCFTIPG